VNGEHRKPFRQQLFLLDPHNRYTGIKPQSHQAARAKKKQNKNQKPKKRFYFRCLDEVASEDPIVAVVEVDHRAEEVVVVAGSVAVEVVLVAVSIMDLQLKFSVRTNSTSFHSSTSSLV
jgi:dsDNA-specific endonuclease/ATPase MutS2